MFLSGKIQFRENLFLKNERTNEQTNERSSERIEQKFMNEILNKTRFSGMTIDCSDNFYKILGIAINYILCEKNKKYTEKVQ